MYGMLEPTIRSVSHSAIASSEGSVPRRPMPPVVYGLSSGTHDLPSRALTIGAPENFRNLLQLYAGVSAPRPARIAIFLPAFRRSAAASGHFPLGSARRFVYSSETWFGLFRIDRVSSFEV